MIIERRRACVERNMGTMGIFLRREARAALIPKIRVLLHLVKRTLAKVLHLIINGKREQFGKSV